MTNKNYSKLLLLVAAALSVISALVVTVFDANTFANFSFKNLTFNLFLKAFFLIVFIFVATTAYFYVRFKKNGIFLGMFTALSAAVSSIVAFDLCLLCRAPLGDITFAVMLLSIVAVYTVSVIFADNSVRVIVKKKKQKTESTQYETAVIKTRKALAVAFSVVVITIVAAAILSFVFSAYSLALYAAPAVVSVAYSVALALQFGCRSYTEKI